MTPSPELRREHADPERRSAPLEVRRVLLVAAFALLAVLVLAVLVAWLGQDPWETFAYEGFN